MKRSWALFLILFLGLCGCGLLMAPTFKLQTLYRQRIANSPKVIYDFSFGGSNQFSGDWRGKSILDSTEKFPGVVNSRKAIDELPCCFIVNNLNDQDLKMAGLVRDQPREQDTLLIPFSQIIEKHSGVHISLAQYRQTYGSHINSGLQRHSFRSFAETADSLILYGVVRIGGKILPDTISFPKGNIKLVDSADGALNYIEIGELVIEHGDIYKPGQPLTLVHNQAIVDERMLEFYPMTQTAISAFTDYGLYKRVGIK
jgi:hypothetical protein